MIWGAFDPPLQWPQSMQLSAFDIVHMFAKAHVRAASHAKHGQCAFNTKLKSSLGPLEGFGLTRDRAFRVPIRNRGPEDIRLRWSEPNAFADLPDDAAGHGAQQARPVPAGKLRGHGGGFLQTIMGQAQVSFFRVGRGLVSRNPPSSSHTCTRS